MLFLYIILYNNLMKRLIDTINEKLIVNKHTRSKHLYSPETRDELIECIANHLNNNNTDLTDIDVSKITEFYSIFRRMSRPGYREFTEIDVTGWDTSNVTDMSRVFFNCFKLTKIKGIENWDVSNVKSMRSMFYNCNELNVDLRNWNIKPECNIEKIAYEAEFVKLPKLY